MYKKANWYLVEECSEDLNGNGMIYNVNLNNHGNVFNSCTINIALLNIMFIISIGVLVYEFTFISLRKKIISIQYFDLAAFL